MHNNYYFYRELVPVLEKRLKATRLDSCFSQNRDELILRFSKVGESFVIKADLQPAFSCLSFPSRFDRARKNAADVFPSLINLRVEGLRLFDNERSFAILFEDNWVLLFKMHGNRSNILAYHNEIFIDMFKKNLRKDSLMLLAELDRKIAWDYEYFLVHRHHLPSAFFTLGKPVWSYLEARGFEALSPEEQWKQLEGVHRILLSPTFCAVEAGGDLSFSLLPHSGISWHWEDPVIALTEFYRLHTRHSAYHKTHKAVQAKLSTTLEARENALQKTTTRLNALRHEKNYREWADLLMANLHNIKTGVTKVTLPSHYDQDRQIEVKLKREWSAAQNAAFYYSKARNQRKEVDQLQLSIERWTHDIAELKKKLHQLQEAKDMTSLQALDASLGDTSAESASETEKLFHRFEHMGFVILVGKSAKNNDLLTKHHAYKEDLWFHVRDAPGSHVLVKYQAGKQYPGGVITYAAQLAAYYSKRRQEHTCPVVFTSRKFVRKRKGDAAGAVVLDREKTLLVSPGLVPEG